jgi:hypothetical protein
MPYKRDQAVAIFLDVKRRKGKKAAEKFGRKHREDFKGPRKYVPQGRRNG